MSVLKQYLANMGQRFLSAREAAQRYRLNEQNSGLDASRLKLAQDRYQLDKTQAKDMNWEMQHNDAKLEAERQRAGIARDTLSHIIERDRGEVERRGKIAAIETSGRDYGPEGLAAYEGNRTNAEQAAILAGVRARMQANEARQRGRITGAETSVRNKLNLEHEGRKKIMTTMDDQDRIKLGVDAPPRLPGAKAGTTIKDELAWLRRQAEVNGIKDPDTGRIVSYRPQDVDNINKFIQANQQALSTPDQPVDQPEETDEDRYNRILNGE